MSVSAIRPITVLSPFPSPSSPKAGNASAEGTAWGPATRVEVTNRETIEEARVRIVAAFERNTPPDVRARLIAQQGRGGGGFGPSTEDLKSIVASLSKFVAIEGRVEGEGYLDKLKSRFGEAGGTKLFEDMTQRYRELKTQYDSLSAMLAARLEQEAKATAGNAGNTSRNMTNSA